MFSDIRFGWALDPGPLERIVEQALACEKYGFDSSWMLDHFTLPIVPHKSIPETFTTLAYLGAKTSEITLGTAVTDVFKRHPATVAQAAITLNNILKGKFVLGIGVGNTVDHKIFGLPVDNLIKRFVEGVTVIKMLLKAGMNEKVNFKGEFFSLKGASLQMKPYSKSGVPLYIAALERRMLQIAGMYGDGWLSDVQTPKSFKETLCTEIKRGLQKVDRSLDSFTPSYVATFAISKDSEAAEAVAEGPSKLLLARSPYILERICPSALVGEMSYSEIMNNPELRASIAEKIDRKQALEIAICGDPDECIAQVEAFARAGSKQIILMPHWIREEKLLESAKLFGERVIRYFR